jgi:hypothetical protein
MPTWGELLNEFNQLSQTLNRPAFDELRRKYLLLLNQHTQRNTIFYATNWTQPTGIDSDSISITDEDVQGFMETVHGLQGDSLDLIIHSPGGSAESAEGIVSYLRDKFSDIRVIIPQAAMSAATMIACAADTIVMGRQSSIGPIDPQMLIPTQFGIKMTPAQAIVDEFEEAQNISKTDPNQLGAWLPILSQYSPGLLQQCKNAKSLAESLVSDWLEAYMFNGEENAKTKAAEIASLLAEHGIFKTHSRHINRYSAINLGLKIENLEDDQTLQDLVLSVFHAATITFQGGTVKIIENHNGKAFVKLARTTQMPPRNPNQPNNSDQPNNPNPQQ